VETSEPRHFLRDPGRGETGVEPETVFGKLEKIRTNRWKALHERDAEIALPPPPHKPHIISRLVTIGTLKMRRIL
jgi:hypothetical protein